VMTRKFWLTFILVSGLCGQSLTRFDRRVYSQDVPPRPVASPKSTEALSNADFAKLIDRLSESGGYFDTDNLISNEASYLHVLGKLKKMGLRGGAYIGVGPDQNFSYIAQLRPQIVYIIDIRRDNLLEHLFFKALFAGARNRVEYLCLLFGKPAPEALGSWDAKSIQQIVEYIDRTPSRRNQFDGTRAAVAQRIKSIGLTLTEADYTTIARIHEAFFSAGLDLRFTSRNRPARQYYPTYRDLLVEHDLTGRQASYLADEGDFQFLKSLEARNLIVPVVGNFAGERALSAIGRDVAERGLRVSAFYASNVEFYLMREGGFDRFIENMKHLPYDERSLIIRSYFSGAFGYAHPQSVPGYFSTQLLQTIESLIKEHSSGGYESYSDLVTKHLLDLR